MRNRTRKNILLPFLHPFRNPRKLCNVLCKWWDHFFEDFLDGGELRGNVAHTLVILSDLAENALSEASKELSIMDNTKKEVLYEKGLIHTEMGGKEAALDCFKQIYEVDYGYRDVAQRVEASYA